MNVVKVSSHVKRNLLAYTVAALLVGLIMGYIFGDFFKSHQAEVKDAIIAVAILTIYPSMIQLRTENLAKSAKRIKEILIGMIFVFLVAPVIAFIFAKAIRDPYISLGFVTSNVVPASSASLGYVLLAEGNIELATVLAVFSLIGAMGAIPAYVGFYAGISSIPLPMNKIIQSIIYTLLTPFIAGQLTRYYFIKRRSHAYIESAFKDRANIRSCTFSCLVRAAEKDLQLLEKDFKRLASCIERRLESQVKPHLSLATMISMLVLISLLIANKAILLIQKPSIALEILALQAAMLVILLALITFLDKIMRIRQGEHSAIAFISATKNQSVAAAIAVMALGPKAAIPPALVPAIQAPIAIVYLQILPRIKGLFS